ncbi:uncharacterized protein J7T54_001193 [Emericellopsis cladophorae]|uniref:Uncharacterized protein n=1 Tax=Emericellopsis cladophorae TaxID=2686198 RepID=A0A9P9Y0H1_9HYPO|nr:uncharacterized protein J7T54_001193 [Emericellopsis cladophorae]KAI6780689.1 hypothetical protein J7T54_001193 [Emericellopsis cladophorae]
MAKLSQRSRWVQLRLERAEIFKSLMLKDDLEPVVSSNTIYSIIYMTTEALAESFNIAKAAIKASGSEVMVDAVLMEALLAEVFEGWDIPASWNRLDNADVDFSNGNADSQASYCVHLNYYPPSLRFYYADTVWGRELGLDEIKIIFHTRHESISRHEHMELLETVGKDMRDMIAKENKSRAIRYIRRMIIRRNNATIDPRRALQQHPDTYHFMDFDLDVMQRYPWLNVVRGSIKATQGLFSSMQAASGVAQGKGRRENFKQKRSVRFPEATWKDTAASSQ